jgi:hypothetical protein
MARLANRPAATATLVVLSIVALALPAAAANVVLVNQDPPGAGLNDPTPVAPVGGNPGVTLGEQRTNVYLFAADLWGSVIDSSVPIFVGATFQPLPCTPTSGTLGAAGATFINANFPGAGFTNTWYHTALADSLAGVDLVPGNLDIVSFFNSDVDTNPSCLTGSKWYYGFDHDQGSDIDFLNVVVHEIAHGLGFSNFTSEVTGAFIAGLPGIYDVFTLDDITGKTWDQMTNAERQASAVNTSNVVWNGAAVTAAAPAVLGPRPSVRVLNPQSIRGSMEAQAASFGPALTGGGGTTGQLVVADDGVGATADACEPLTNNAHGKIVLADRGACTFTTKALNAQAAGAKGLVVANSLPKGLAPMGGSDPNVHIPSVGISQADGVALRTAHKPNVKLILDGDFLAGAVPTGLVRLYAPDPVASGSSISHWDTSATPNLIMEPFINPDLEAANDLDLTPFLFLDIGWHLLP